MNARYLGKQQLNPTTWSFQFAPEKPLQFIAGQFIELQLPHPNPDNRAHQRWFTISSAPQERELTITTRLGTHPSIFKRTLAQLQPDDRVTIAPPMGDFVVPKLATIPLLFIASGIGVTPFASIVKDLNNRHEQRDITMVHHARSTADLLFTELFSTLPRYQTLTAATPHKTSRHSNIITGRRITDVCMPTDEHYVYIAGPEHTVERLIIELTELGCNPRHIYTDFFQGYD